MKKDLTYSKALGELQKLVEEIENGSVALEKLSQKVEKANEYILFCETRLRGLEEGVKAVRGVSVKKK